MDFAAEELLWRQGYAAVAGVDEAGRGPLAGPVVAAACVLPPDYDLSGLNDSKKLSAARRERLNGEIRANAAAWAIGRAEAAEIDAINILQATKLAMTRALAALSPPPDFVLLDGRDRLTLTVPQRALIGGDGICASIAAASILAKVERDGYMAELHRLYPRYGFDRHKGYGVKAHLQALAAYGPCREHRRSFAPVRRAAAGTLLAGAAANESKTLGELGEIMAADYLRAAGLSILERNYRTRGGEIDIIAQDGETLAFIEVKTRLSGRSGRAAENLTLSKLKKMELAALFYLKARKYKEWPSMRFDAVTVEWRGQETVTEWIKGISAG
ncbi:MAG: ribonuclease HII [Gracilibacteraceae bacterium]|jgi:ribonuclease HII|nr:ribonuclease HII [Gracilibacteraceae bacterium]